MVTAAATISLCSPAIFRHTAGNKSADRGNDLYCCYCCAIQILPTDVVNPPAANRPMKPDFVSKFVTVTAFIPAIFGGNFYPPPHRPRDTVVAKYTF